MNTFRQNEINFQMTIIQGLVSVVFGQLKNALSVTLVSDGAECIRIRKSFFIKMTTESLFDRLRREVNRFSSKFNNQSLSCLKFFSFRFDLTLPMMNYRKNFNVKSIGQHIKIYLSKKSTIEMSKNV